MCEFHGSNSNGFGDIWWTDNPIYFSSIDYNHVLQNTNVWLGGLFIPEAFITATRQYVAHANSWSLEKLYLEVSNLEIGLNLKQLCLHSMPYSRDTDMASFEDTKRVD